MMTRHLLHAIAAGAIVVGGATVAAAQPGSRAAVDVPPALEVPAGHAAFLQAHAVGTQNYVCLPANPGVAWRFLGPQATLFLTVGRGYQQQIATHFLSANPSENDLPRPVWQHSFDTSRAWARALAASSDPLYVEPGAIPWLLLEVTGAERGPADGGLLTAATFIQRVRTSGGITPASGCSTAADTGAVVMVPYAADYIFYKARRRR